MHLLAGVGAFVRDCGNMGCVCPYRLLPGGFLNYEPQIMIMKKLFALIAGFVMLLLMTSAFVDKRQEAVLGEKAPALVINSCDGEMSLKSLEGNWVILSFWSAADAQSRMMQNDVAAYVRGISDPGKAHNLEIVSVNFDRSENLMKEIVRLDNLDENSQFHIEDADEAYALRQAYRMNEGLRTFVINPKGELVAADPTISDLQAIIG